MIKMNLRSYITGVSPEDVFYALADRDSLQTLMPRVRKVEYRDRGMESETVIMHVSIGQTFGTIRCEGKLSWNEPHDLTFEVKTPLPVKTHWVFRPAVNGTELDISMQLSLEPMLGPAAMFVPKNVVEDMLLKEMKQAVQNVAARAKEGMDRDRAVAA